MSLSNVLIALIASAFVGVLLGLVPLICGLVKKRVGLAIGGFAACLGGGFLLGLLLGVPMCILFTLLVFLTKPQNAAAQGQYPGQPPYPAQNQPPYYPPAQPYDQPRPRQDLSQPEKMPWEEPEQK